jgi:hypothetical protein
MDGQLREEPLRGGFMADDMHRLFHSKGGLDQMARDELGQHIRHTDGEVYWPPSWHSPDHVLKLPAEAEDLVGIAEDHVPNIGEHEAPPLSSKQLLSETILQVVDLRADRLGRQVELGARAGEIPMPRDGPEVAQMLVVQPVHETTSSFDFIEY